MNYASDHRHSRSTLRAIDCRAPRRNDSSRSALAAQMRLRRGNCNDRREGPVRLHPELRVRPARGDGQAGVQARRKQCWGHSRTHPALQHLEQNAPTVQQSECHEISLMGRSRHPGLRGMERLPSLQRMGTRQRLRVTSYDRSGGQRQGLFAEQLPMGHLCGAAGKPEANEGVTRPAYGWLANRVGQ